MARIHGNTRYIASKGSIPARLQLLLALAGLFALACSCLIAAPSAYADPLTASDVDVQAQDGSIVYDSAYGVFGGKYALMYKSVAYDSSTDGSGQAKTGTVYDLLNADGEVTVHTSSLPESSAVQPGGWTDLQIANFGRFNADINSGYVKVSEKSTSRYGVRSVDGAELVACKYDELDLYNGHFIGVRDDSGRSFLDILGLDGSIAGSVELPESQHQELLKNAWVSPYKFGECIGFVVGRYYEIASGNPGESELVHENAYILMNKNGDAYAPDGNVSLVYAVNYEGAVYKAVDGKVYLRSREGADTVICDAANIKSADIYSAGVIALMDGGGKETEFLVNSQGKAEPVLDWTGNGALVARDDGYCYYRPFEGADVKIASTQNYVSASIEGPFIEITYKNGNSYDKCYRLDGSELTGAVHIMSSASHLFGNHVDGGALVQYNDGFFYFVSADGAKTKIATCANCYDAKLQSGFIHIEYDDGSDWWDSWFATSGAALPETPIELNPSDGYALFETDENDGISSFAIYNTEGEMLATFSGSSAHMLVVHNADGRCVNLRYAVVTSEQVASSGAGGDGWSYKHSMKVYNLNGTLAKDIGEVVQRNSRLENVKVSRIYGYELSAEDSITGQAVYYDLHLNVLDHKPTRSDYNAAIGDFDGGGSGGGSTGEQTPSYILPNGTSLFVDYKTITDGGYAVANANGDTVSIGGYRLSIFANVGQSRFNSLRHGNSDIWWARNASGKWGAIDSSGTVKVPFEYDGYYDGGYANTVYALVKQGSAWGFVDVNTGIVKCMVGTSDQDSGEPGSPIRIDNAKVSAATQTYTGSALVPIVKVEFNGAELPESAYSTSCPKAVKAGKYLVTVTGIGAYAGTATGVFKVAGKKLSGCLIGGVSNKVFTGKKIKQSKLTVSLDGEKLKRGRDYRVSYTKNKAAGKARITILGKGNYAGKATETFTIKKARISKAKVKKITKKALKQVGKAVTPKVVVKYKGKKLKKGRDYGVTYKNNTDRGMAKVIIRGKGNFKGKKVVKFEIV